MSDLFGAVIGEEPLVDGGVNVVELGGFYKKRRSGGRGAFSVGQTSGDEFEVAEGCEEGGAGAGGVLPAFAGFEAQ